MDNETQNEELVVDEPAFWEYERTFENQEALDQFLKEEKCWSLFKKDFLKKGIKTTWRCNKVKRRGKKCKSGIYTLKAPGKDEVQLFRLRANHDCGESTNQSKGKVSEKVRDFILAQYKLGNPPATIVFQLREMKDIDQPSKEQVSHIINYYKEKTPNTVVSISDLENFVKANNTVPNDDDDPFVVNFTCSPPRTPSEQKFFRIFFSTKRLLSHALLSINRHSDGTYQIITEDFPVLTLGVSDADNHFHLNGLAITASETGDDYQFLFDSLQHGVKLVTGSDLQAGRLIADMAPAITNGFRESFKTDQFTRVHCFTHLMSNVEKQKFKTNEIKEAIKSDIRKLQVIHSKDLFDVGCQLLEEKWKNEEPAFIKYFKETYIDKNSNWYEGVADRTPKTNNCLEVFHRLIKQQQTMHLRKPFAQAIPLALSIVKERSKAYVLDKAAPVTSVTVTDEMKLNGWNYSQSKKHLHLEKTTNGTGFFYAFAGDNLQKVTAADVTDWESNAEYADFDDFIEKSSKMYRISFDGDLSDLDRAKCTCVAYAKKNMCKHILAVAYRMQALNPPDDLLKATETPAPVKNKRGRPKKAKKALIVD